MVNAGSHVVWEQFSKEDPKGRAFCSLAIKAQKILTTCSLRKTLGQGSLYSIPSEAREEQKKGLFALPLEWTGKISLPFLPL